MEKDYGARSRAQAIRLRESRQALILAVESSCDETAVAIVRDGRVVLANCIASQIDTHALYGGFDTTMNKRPPSMFYRNTS